MSDYLSILEKSVEDPFARALMEEVKRRPFRLHPGLDPQKYEITSSMKDAPTKWRAYSYTGASYQDPTKSFDAGTMTNVGYVMISLKDDTIIPIARGDDEHHQGHDVLSDEISKMCRKNGHPINQQFIPIFSWGTNYIYAERDIPPMLNALEKFLAYGGIDGPLRGSSSMRGVLLNSSDFVASGGAVSLKTGELAPVGQMVMRELSNLSTAIREADPSKPSTVGRAFQTAVKTCRALCQYRYSFGVPKQKEDALEILCQPEILGDLKKQGDVRKLEEIIFGFHGLKNAIHDGVRGYNVRKKKGEKDVWKDDDILAIWGDPEMAEDMLGRM